MNTTETFSHNLYTLSHEQQNEKSKQERKKAIIERKIFEEPVRGGFEIFFFYLFFFFAQTSKEYLFLVEKDENENFNEIF